MSLAAMTIDPGVFVQLGIAGVMLYWFMFRMERKADIHTATINDLVNAITLDILSRENISMEVRSRADMLSKRSQDRARTLPRTESDMNASR